MGLAVTSAHAWRYFMFQTILHTHLPFYIESIHLFLCMRLPCLCARLFTQCYCSSHFAILIFKIALILWGVGLFLKVLIAVWLQLIQTATFLLW